MRWSKLAYPRPKQPILASFIGAMVDRLNWIRHVAGDDNVSLQVTDGTLQARFIGAFPVSSGTGDDSFLAVLTAATAMTDHTIRFWYTWAELVSGTSLLPSSGAVATYVTAGGRSGSGATVSGSNLGGAYNLAELLHVPNPGSTTAWYASGVQVNPDNTSTDYPSTWSPRSLVYGGSRIARLRPQVWGGEERMEIMSVGGNLTHDGLCP